MEVVREAQKVAKLKSDLTSQGLETRQLAPLQETSSSSSSSSSSLSTGGTAATTKSFTGPDGVRTHLANNVEWMTLDDPDAGADASKSVARPAAETITRYTSTENLKTLPMWPA